MNDMRSKKWFVKIHYKGKLVEIKEIWSDTERIASMMAHKDAVSLLESQIETQEETTKRIAEKLIADLEDALQRARDWNHEWPEYMDDTEEDREKRRKLHATIDEYSTKLCDARQTFDLRYA